MLLKQLFDYDTWTYTYIIADEKTREAAIIDSVYEQADRDAKVLTEMGLELKYILETHVHADHITGASMLKEKFPEAKTALSVHGGASCPDMFVDDGQTLTLGGYTITVLSTPGHTNGCISFLVDGKIFTGDSLFIRGCGRTDFQQGSPEKLYNSVVEKLFTLPDETIVYPGHNYAGLLESTIGEEKKFNPRLAGKTKEEFISIMEQLHLPYPKKIMESVPANLQCGQISKIDSIQAA